MPRGVNRIDRQQIPKVVMDALSQCQKLGGWLLYLWGDTGSGKSCAAAEIYRYWTAPAAWYVLSELCEILKGYNNSQFQMIPTSQPHQPVELSLNGFWKRIANLGLVVIDEIGTREATPQRYDALRDLLDARSGKPLILTGNLDPVKKLATTYDERVQSRIAAGTLVQLIGDDRRTSGMAKRIFVGK